MHVHERDAWRRELGDVQPAKDMEWLDITRGLSGALLSCGWAAGDGSQWAAMHDSKFDPTVEGAIFRIEKFDPENHRVSEVIGYVPIKYLLWVITVGWAEQSRTLWDAVDEYVDARLDGEWNGNIPEGVRRLVWCLRGPDIIRNFTFTVG